MTTFFLIISLALTAYLAIYAAVFIFFAVAIWFLKKEKIEISRKSYGGVSILVPAHNEGEGVIDAVNTVVNQDYAGLIKIYVLADNFRDSFVGPLKNFYKFKDADSEEGVLRLWGSEKREVFLIFTGLVQKKDKINFWIHNISSDYIGFLDADHRAEKNWVSSSLLKMEKEGAEAVQSRRRPLAVSTIFQIWDSAQNHIGNEAVNFVLSAISPSVFFTGTTCIFKSDVFKKYKFEENITEDTYLSYDLICGGEKISYNGASSSYEEVASDIRSYIFRRRRWSAGHTKTFIDHFKKIIEAPFGLMAKLGLLIHGQFYLIPMAVGLLLNAYGAYFFLQFTRNIQFAVLFIAVAISASIAAFFRKKGNNFCIDGAVSFFWILPQISAAAIWFYKILDSEIYYYILSFPLIKIFFPLHMALLFAPLLALVSGIFFFGQFKNPKNFLLIPTYPLIMFLDIYACLLGFADFLFGKYNWAGIKRQNIVSEEIVPPSVRSQISTGRTIRTDYRKLIWAAGGIILLFLVNDLLAFDNCGDIKKFLWQPIFIKPSSSVVIDVGIERRIMDDKSLEVLIKNKFKSAGEINIKNYFDGKMISEKTVSGSGEDIQTLNFPLGWESHEAGIVVKSPNVICRRTKYFSTSFKEIKEKSLYVNNEKFLIKGVIPSFSNKLTNLPLDAGLKQIKESGANTVRFYHAAGEGIRRTAAKYNLMVIDQPDQSTWDEFDLDSFLSRKLYLSRYKKMIKNNEGYQYLLFDGLGNEWELGGKDPNLVIPKIKNFIEKTLSSGDSELSSYSTYLTFVDYPVNILGVNMLDTGATYWDKAIDILKNTKKPFYASEFGGFVAFWETAPTDLRIARFVGYWKDLLEAGALGANFFESHDNWAQPVVEGYNDPFKPEQPDDARGLWDKANKEKLELKFLREIFSDFEVGILNETVSRRDKEIEIELKNKREYALKGTIVNYGNVKVSAGDFKPLESKIVKLPIGLEEVSASKIQLTFSYTTHSGLSNISVAEIVLPVAGDAPVIINNDFLEEGVSPDNIKGRLIFSDKVEAVIPDSWPSFEFNGRRIEKSGKRAELAIENPFHNVSGLRFSVDGLNWSPFDSEKIKNGLYYLRFELPKISNSKQYLILAGLGADSILMNYGDGKVMKINAHNYRENVIDLAALGQEVFGGYITLKIDRQQTVYVTKEDAPSGREVLVDMELPRVFSPADIEIKKAL